MKPKSYLVRAGLLFSYLSGRARIGRTYFDGIAQEFSRLSKLQDPEKIDLSDRISELWLSVKDSVKNGSITMAEYYLGRLDVLFYWIEKRKKVLLWKR